MTSHAVDAWLQGDLSANWELFHENSKTDRHTRAAGVVAARAAALGRFAESLRRVKPYTDFPKVGLPPPVERAGEDTTALPRRGTSMGLQEFAQVLAGGHEQAKRAPGPSRPALSEGACYPLELYVHARRVQGLEPGLYHFDPEDLTLDVLRLGDASSHLGTIVGREADAADAVVFVSAIFLRCTLKDGDRGYRFALLEAGHVAQRAYDAAAAAGLHARCVGDYLDRDVDRWIGLDGLSESVIYVMIVDANRPRS